jgi:hypothetical protein
MKKNITKSHYLQTHHGENIRNICNRALKKQGFIKRIVGKYSDEKVREICNFALVRPHLRYAASFWDPGHKDLILRLNKKQWEAVCFVKKSQLPLSKKKQTKSITPLIEADRGLTRLGTMRDSRGCTPDKDYSRNSGQNCFGNYIYIH